MTSTASPEYLLTFPAGSLQATFCRREKRFLVEVETQGRRFWVHTNNSGSMLGLLRRGCNVWISPAQRPGRKLPYTLELVQWGAMWIGVNTLTPNRLLRLAWKAGCMPELAGYESFKAEAKSGASRLDANLSGHNGSLWVEAKNVTLVEEDVAYFPDAITTRGQKHLTELMALVRTQQRVACFYLIQRADARCFGPADFIDAGFNTLFWQAVDEGVEVWPYLAHVSPAGIGLGPRLPLSRLLPSP